jgi:hypothetical protein
MMSILIFWEQPIIIWQFSSTSYSYYYFKLKKIKITKKLLILFFLLKIKKS